MSKSLVILFLLMLATFVYSQDSTVAISGKVFHSPPIDYSSVMVLNMSRGQGFLVNSDGTFTMNARYGQKLQIFAEGYKTVYIHLRDSIFKPSYYFEVELKELAVIMKEGITIRPRVMPEDIETARERIDKYRYEKLAEGPVSILQSPITAIYQAFSKKEQEKREYVALLNEQAYDEALEELVYYYINADLFFLREQDLHDFMAFCNLDRQFVKYASMYDMGVALSNCHKQFVKQQKLRN